MSIWLFRRLIFVSLTILALGNLTLAAALACDSGFTQVSSTIPGTSGTLKVRWTEAGLTPGQTINYKVSTQVTAVYTCITDDDSDWHSHPPNTKTIHRHVVTRTSFIADRNGTVHGWVALDPPNGRSLHCSDDQKRVLASVAYQDDPIFDLTNHVTTGVPDASRVYFP